MRLPSCNSHNFLGLATNACTFDLAGRDRQFRWLFPASERSVVGGAPTRRPAMNGGTSATRVPTMAEGVLVPPAPKGMHLPQNSLPVLTA